MHRNIDYIHFDTIDSTNQWAKTHAASLDPKRISCITSLEQTAGRGRGGKTWKSPHGQNIYATLYFTLPPEAPYLANLGQILSLSCCTILKAKGFNPQIKWPNDLLIEGKKVAGILCEIIQIENRLGIILGIGINVNMTQELLNTIDQPATSLAQLSGHNRNLEQILEPLVQQFFQDLQTVQEQGFRPLRTRYEQLLAYRGQVITYRIGEQLLHGICDSIDESGRLNLLLDDGSILHLSAGKIIQ